MKLPPFTLPARLRLLSLAGTLPLLLASAGAAEIRSEWTGGGAGNFLWEAAANWDTADYPHDNGSDRYGAFIGNATGERTITTSGELRLANFWLEQTSATGRSILKLGGDLHLETIGTSSPLRTPSASITNTTGDATRQVIDLQGHHLNVEIPLTYSNLAGAQYYTVRSTGTTGGLYSLAQIFSNSSANDVRIEDDVTVRITTANSNRFDGYRWSDASTLHLAFELGSTQTPRYLYLRGRGDNALSNLIVGDTSGIKTEVELAFDAAPSIPYRLVRGNVTIHQGARIALISGRSPLAVGGDFLDTNTTDDYGNGSLLFVGGGVEQTVSIAREGLTTAIGIGSRTTAHGLEQGKVRLLRDLITEGAGKLYDGSELNVDTFRLETGSLEFEDGARLTLGFGDGAGEVVSQGDLLLGEFHLTLDVKGASWTNGDDLVLFRYDGDLIGTPGITGFTFRGAELVSYDALMHDASAGTLYLSNVTVIPEPKGLLLAGLAVCLILYRRRKTA
ncbi:MAG TPA: hypothetical protein VNQ90_15835 [Chthoniobacteraceae bacterium]|nr:hypothetical protein [Chthoniobacteraceae bacterium]